jgi:hypothetical protein
LLLVVAGTLVASVFVVTAADVCRVARVGVGLRAAMTAAGKHVVNALRVADG